MEETVENVLVQDDAAIDAEKGEETGFYKSQKEVDKAFKKRLERERKKWEQSLEKGTREKQSENNLVIEKEENKKEDTVEDELSKMGDELHSYLERIEDEGELPENNIERPDEETEKFVESILKEVQELEDMYEEVDLTEDFDNPLFTHMLKEGQPLKKVYDYFNPEKNKQAIYKQIEHEVTERIRARNSKPSSIAHSNANNASYDISRFTQKDIEEIDKRVRRGERVVL